MTITISDEDWGQFYKLVFRVKRSIKYHDLLHGHFEFWSNFVAASYIIVGGLVVAVGGEIQQITSAGLFILSSTSAILIIFKFQRRNQVHMSLRQQYQKLDVWLKNVEVLEEITADNIVHGNKRLADIEIDEPTVLRVLNIVCYNETVIALKYHDADYYDVPAHRRWICKFGNFGTHENFKKTKPPILNTEETQQMQLNQVGHDKGEAAA